MNATFNLKNLFAATLLTAGMLTTGSNSADAGHQKYFVGTGGSTSQFVQPQFTPRFNPSPTSCTGSPIGEWQYQTVEYVEYVTRYRPCGAAYMVPVVRTRVIRVPVRRPWSTCGW